MDKTKSLIIISSTSIAIVVLVLLLFNMTPLTTSTHSIILTSDYVIGETETGEKTVDLAYKMKSHYIENNITHETKDVTFRYSQNATIPGPIIQIDKYDTVLLKIENGLDDGCVSVHVHGLSYTIENDGTLKSINGVSDQCAKPGADYDYLWNADAEGTWPYHDHTYCNSLLQTGVDCENFEGVNGAENLGLYGAFIVNGDSAVKVIDGKITKIHTSDIAMDYVLYMDSNLQFHGTAINNTSQIQTPLGINPTLTAKDQTDVRFSIIGVGNAFHTFHLHSNKWLDPGTTNIIDTANIGPLERTSFVVTAGGNGGGPGDWQYHCHVYDHMTAGMSGIFKVI